MQGWQNTFIILFLSFQFLSDILTIHVFQPHNTIILKQCSFRYYLVFPDPSFPHTLLCVHVGKFSFLTTHFSAPFNTGLKDVNSTNFCLFENVFISLPFKCLLVWIFNKDKNRYLRPIIYPNRHHPMTDPTPFTPTFKPPKFIWSKTQTLYQYIHSRC